VARLPNVLVLNGGDRIPDNEREDAERWRDRIPRKCQISVEDPELEFFETLISAKKFLE
jgi:hypothetical protein